MTTENNKIIAEFMGAKEIITETTHRIYKEFEMYGIIESIEDREDIKHFYQPEEMLFNSDWNWLMEVVEKIETKKYYKKEVQFSITKYSVKIQTLTNEDGLIISPCIFSSWGTYGPTQKMKAIYNACLEFIKWYNLQNS